VSNLNKTVPNSSQTASIIFDYNQFTSYNYLSYLKEGIMNLKIIQIRPQFEIVLSFLSQSTPIEELPKSEGLFVFGHVDPRLALHSAVLYKTGKMPRVVLTGKGGRKTIPDRFETEADYYASILRKEGVPESAMILERNSMNSLENIVFGIEACYKVGFYPQTLVISSIPALMLRSLVTFRKQFPGINVSASTFDINSEEYTESERILRILEEFDRFEEYARKGDVEPVNVPKEISKAVEYIKSVLL